MERSDNKSVTFINGVQEADLWLLPDTAQNRKSSLWGAAGAAKVKTGESVLCPLCEPGDGGLYLLRMIDVDGFCYYADGLALEAGWTVRIQMEDNDLQSVTVTVRDASGAESIYPVFAARL